MENRDEVVRTSDVLDVSPRLFNLPVTVILPIMFLSGITTFIIWTIQAEGYLLIAANVAVNAAYFFLFGQEWWRLVCKFKHPPRLVRGDVRAVPLTLRGRTRKR